MDGDSLARLIYLGILVIAVAGWFVASNRPSIGKSLQMALVWGLIFMGVIAIYGLWGDISDNFNRHGVTYSEGQITVPRGRDGHYHLSVMINDVPVDFLVDTGASDLVLTRADAARVGIDVDNLAFTRQAQTANGVVPIALTRLEKIELGEFQDFNVYASVNGGEMSGSLLGMSYLDRFGKIEISGQNLILHR